jgi:hypothetical protein
LKSTGFDKERKEKEKEKEKDPGNACVSQYF